MTDIRIAHTPSWTRFSSTPTPSDEHVALSAPVNGVAIEVDDGIGDLDLVLSCLAPFAAECALRIPLIMQSA